MLICMPPRMTTNTGFTGEICTQRRRQVCFDDEGDAADDDDIRGDKVVTVEVLMIMFALVMMMMMMMTFIAHERIRDVTLLVMSVMLFWQ